MADLTELEHRLKAALSRISAGIDRWPSPHSAPLADQSAVIAHLQAELDAERLARTQREASLPSTQDHTPAAELVLLQRQLAEADLENQRLLAAIAGLRQDLRLMDEQAEANLAEANRAIEVLQGDLNALTQARDIETAEIAKILAALAPLIDAEEADPHAGT